MTRAIAGGVATVACAAAGLVLVASPANADTDAVLGVSLYSVSDSQVQFNVCLTEGIILRDSPLSNLGTFPAHATSTYTVSTGGSTVTSVDWSLPADVIYIDTPACPDAFTTLAAGGLNPNTTYTITVAMTLDPKYMNDDDDYIDDPRRTRVTVSGSLTVTTEAHAANDPGTVVGDPGTVVGDPGTVVGTGTGGSSGGTSAGSGGASGTTIVTISDPRSFSAAQLGALSPAQVATIAPTTFGQLPPSTFRALTAAQAGELTPQQTSSIRAARAAELTPRAVAALDPLAVATMRPSAIKFLTPAAISAMTNAQLKALTPRQIAALRPKQLAVMSAVEKSLLRRR